MKIAKLFAKRSLALLVAVMLCVGLLNLTVLPASAAADTVASEKFSFMVNYGYVDDNREFVILGRRTVVGTCNNGSEHSDNEHTINADAIVEEAGYKDKGTVTMTDGSAWDSGGFGINDYISYDTTGSAPYKAKQAIWVIDEDAEPTVDPTPIMPTPSHGDGEDDEGGFDGGLDDETSWVFTVRYHSNYPDHAPNNKTDYVYTMKYTVRSSGSANVTLKRFDEIGFSEPLGYSHDPGKFWYTDPNCTETHYENGGPLSFSQDGNGNETTLDLYAKWIPVPTDRPQYTYTLTYNAMDGKVLGNTKHTIEVVTTKDSFTFLYLEPDERDGYTFDRWYENKECTIPVDWNKGITLSNPETGGKAVATIYANWLEYAKVVYEAGEGIGKDFTESVPGGTTYTVKAPHEVGISAPEGMEFDYWKMKVDDTCKPVDDTCNPADEDDTPSRAQGVRLLEEGDGPCIPGDTFLTEHEKTYTLTAVWKNAPAAYTVQWINKDTNNEIKESATRTGTVGEIVSVEEDDKQIDYYTYVKKGSTESAELKAAGTVLTLYFKAVTWIVTFDPNNGEDKFTQPVLHGGKATLPDEPTKTGHTFGGWYETGAEDPFDFTKGVTGDITLTAHWTANEYTVTFDPKNGDAEFTQPVLHGKNATLPTQPTKTGYTFGGWFDDNADKKWDFEQDTVTNDITLTAHWTANEYTVTFDYNDGVTTDREETVTYGDTVTEPATPEREGHTFDGWYDDNADKKWDFAQDTVTCAITLTAHWTADKYTVTFVYNDNVTSDEKVTVTYGEKVAEPTAPVREGYTFDGWFRGNTDKKWDFAQDTVTCAITLTAHWTADKYTVTFVYNDNVTSDEKVTVTYGEKVAEPAEPVREGYTFDGWFDDNADKKWDFAQDTVTCAITLTAHWTENQQTGTQTPSTPSTPSTTTYTLNYNANGGVGAPSSQRFTTTASSYTFTVSGTVPTRDGHTFEGWSISANGAAAYQPGDPITVTGTRTLYAVWEEIASEDDGTDPIDPSVPGDPGDDDGDDGDNTGDDLPDIPEEDPPLSDLPELDIPEEDPPLGDLPELDIPEEDPPLSDLPELDIPEEDPPLSDLPELDIPEEDPPLGDLPELDIPEEDPPLSDLPELDIPEEDVPLAAVPETGDRSHIWGCFALISGAGLAVLALTAKKREENAE